MDTIYRINCNNLKDISFDTFSSRYLKIQLVDGIYSYKAIPDEVIAKYKIDTIPKREANLLIQVDNYLMGVDPYDMRKETCSFDRVIDNKSLL
jgi:hypothetical protein